MRTLLIDNYDSFTYNLFQLLAETNGDEPLVVRNDDADWTELSTLAFDNIVISPGPGRPDRTSDFGVCADVIRHAPTPLLGVCLGHQGLCWVHGASVINAPDVMHGRLSTVIHDGDSLFSGIPREFEVVRYHSLCVAQPLPEELRAIARTEDDVLMAVAHRRRPQWGVQFHPESICTEYGRRLLANFRDLTRDQGRAAARSVPAMAGTGDRKRRSTIAGDTNLRLKVERIDALHSPEQAFHTLYADTTHAFWLDSSLLDDRARFSFIGAADGRLGAVLTYDVTKGELLITRRGDTTLLNESIFDYLSREMRRLRHLSPDLPFDFNCGFVGYFAYELKADCGGDNAHSSAMPDAAFLFADRLIAFDHVERCTYLLSLADADGEAEAARWVADVRERLAALPVDTGPAKCMVEGAPVDFRLSRSHAQYLKDIASCKRRLIEGETYEVCLTNQITATVNVDPLHLYGRLRRINPAPFSAYLRFGEQTVLSSSPERFLSIGRDRWVEAKPIKGTSPRGETPGEDARLAHALRTDEKNRAENLMITDLLRNDLGVVCEIGTVHVPSLMQVESYETVHQLVSTVRGLLREDLEPPDCIRACFPGGSMTGAPKKRTMEIIDELEGQARGVYSGAIGYLGLCGGCDLSIVIRTIVLDRGAASLGVGGAIVMQSDPEEEYRETLLKGRAPMNALGPATDSESALESGRRATPSG